MVAAYFGVNRDGDRTSKDSKKELTTLNPIEQAELSRSGGVHGFDHLPSFVQQKYLDEAGCKTIDEFKELMRKQRVKVGNS